MASSTRSSFQVSDVEYQVLGHKADPGISVVTLGLGSFVLKIFGSHGTHNSAELLADPVSPHKLIANRGRADHLLGAGTYSLLLGECFELPMLKFSQADMCSTVVSS